MGGWVVDWVDEMCESLPPSSTIISLPSDTCLEPMVRLVECLEHPRAVEEPVDPVEKGVLHQLWC